MAEVLLFHHAMGRTDGFRAFAGELRGAGHTVHAPDLFEGRTFGSIEDQHYFADSSLPSYDEGATTLLTQRVLAFLEARG